MAEPSDVLGSWMGALCSCIQGGGATGVIAELTKSLLSCASDIRCLCIDYFRLYSGIKNNYQIDHLHSACLVIGVANTAVQLAQRAGASH